MKRRNFLVRMFQALVVLVFGPKLAAKLFPAPKVFKLGVPIIPGKALQQATFGRVHYDGSQLLRVLYQPYIVSKGEEEPPPDVGHQHPI